MDFGLESVPTQHRPDRATTKDLGPKARVLSNTGKKQCLDTPKQVGTNQEL